MSIEDLKVKPEILSPKPPSIATDEEFASGTSTTASPTVKQAKEKLVSIDTPQTITGQKAFTTQLVKKSKVIDITTQSEKYTANNGFQFVDKNDNIMGYLENAQQADGAIKTGIHAKNKDGYQPNIGVYAPPSGTTGAYATAPNTPDNAPANAIVTKDKIANMVTTDTAQKITVAKSLSVGGTKANSNVLKIIMPTSTESNPTEVSARTIDFFSQTGSGNRFEGGLVHQRFIKGGSYTGLRAGKLINGTFKEGVMGVRIMEDGTAFGTAPNTPDNAPANAIVTKDKIANMVTTNTAQTISGSKRFTQPAEGMSIELTADTDQQTVPTTGTLRQLGLYINSTYTKGDGYTSWLQALRGSDGWTATELYARRFLESDSQEIINYLRVNITPEGVPISYTKTPPASVSGEEITTAGWFNSKMQVVSALPANPDPNVFYFIPE